MLFYRNTINWGLYFKPPVRWWAHLDWTITHRTSLEEAAECLVFTVFRCLFSCPFSASGKPRSRHSCTPAPAYCNKERRDSTAVSFCVSILSTSVIISSFSVTYPDFYYSISTLLLPSQIPLLLLLCAFVPAVTQFQDHSSFITQDRSAFVSRQCVRVCERAPGWVFDCSLSCEDADEDSNVKVDADGQQGLDVSLVHSCPLVQTVQDDTQSLEFKDGERYVFSTFFLLLWKSGKHLGSVYRDVRKLCWIRSFIQLQRGFFFIKSNRIYEVFLMILAFMFHYCHSQLEIVWIPLLCGKLLVLYAAWNQIMIAHEKVGKRRKDLYENTTHVLAVVQTHSPVALFLYFCQRKYSTRTALSTRWLFGWLPKYTV